MTKGQIAFLAEIKELDDIHLGCLGISTSLLKNADKLERQCLEKGWIRCEPRNDCWRRTMYLTTKGLRAYRRATQ